MSNFIAVMALIVLCSFIAFTTGSSFGRERCETHHSKLDWVTSCAKVDGESWASCEVLWIKKQE